MKKLRIIKLGFILIFIVVFGLLTQHSYANVGLLYFDVTAQSNNTVELRWETATELETAGFILRRSQNNGAFLNLTNIGIPGFVDQAGNAAGFISSQGGPSEGGLYTEIDDTTASGNSYTYQLIEIENDSSEHVLNTQSVTVGTVQATSTSTPTATTASSGSGNSNPTATATILASSTPRPENTSAPQATSSLGVSSATPTRTPQPTPTTAPASAATATTAVAAITNTPPPPVSENNSGENVVLAQEEPTEELATPTAAADNPDSGYPIGEPETLATPTTDEALEPSPYPISTPFTIDDDDDANVTVPVIGSQAGEPTEDEIAAYPASDEGNDVVRQGQLYLWGGFLLALIVFIGAVVGSILLFTRNQSRQK
jgi:hypothetical protein